MKFKTWKIVLKKRIGALSEEALKDKLDALQNSKLIECVGYKLTDMGTKEYK